MPVIEKSSSEKNYLFIFAFIAMLAAAFIQCYRTTQGIHWFFDMDFYRDMSYIQGALYGNFGKDPNYAGQFLWYNPLLVSVETMLVKISGLPINILLLRAGPYINLLSPLAFAFMLWKLFDAKTALAGLLAFLFLTSGNIPTYESATYSPWLYPGTFTQFIFYINVVLCYIAFTRQSYGWFLLLGFMIGVGFLGHTAPTVLMILIMIGIQWGNIRPALSAKDYVLLRKYLLQGLTTFLAFIVGAFPFLYFIVGKYHLHFLNRFPSEYVDGMFIWHNFPLMIKANFSIPFVVAVIGFIWFYRNFHVVLIRKILFYWLLAATGMYIYSTLVVASEHFKYKLPVTVPSFHYFFYFKALQSVFFGFGFLVILRYPVQQLNNRLKRSPGKDFSSELFIAALLGCMIFYYPVYQKRMDFVFFREQAFIKGNLKERIGMYDFIREKIPDDQVILSDQEASIFPVLATARKMVSIGITFSNPYLDFNRRETDRNDMISYFETGQPAAAKALFDDYKVQYVILANKELDTIRTPYHLPNELMLKNDSFTLFSLKP